MKKVSSFPESILEQCVSKEVLHAMDDIINNQKKASVIKGGKIIAEVFGSRQIFENLAEGNHHDIEKTLVGSFHNNLTLLIQKTWVEKSDEVLKDQVLYNLDEVCTLVNEKEYAKVYESFLGLLNDAVFLMFGKLSTKDDFSEYALRIDPAFGVFWWFLKNVKQDLPKDIKVGRLYIILGMLFLANY